RKETQLAARGLAANFRVLLHDKDAPAIRRIMRSYGFQFRGEPEETVNEEPNLESSPEVERLEAGEKDPTAKAEEEPSAGKADVSAASFEPRFGRIPGTAPIKTREPGSADCSSCDIEARIARPPRRDLSPGDATRLISPRGEMDGLQPAGRRRSREKLPSTAYHEPVCGSPSPREEGSAGNLATTGHNHPGTS
nr:hypothetical protein [Acidobacteriota bacterium]